jgi:hypothetical protein
MIWWCSRVLVTSQCGIAAYVTRILQGGDVSVSYTHRLRRYFEYVTQILQGGDVSVSHTHQLRRYFEYTILVGFLLRKCVSV